MTTNVSFMQEGLVLFKELLNEYANQGTQPDPQKSNSTMTVKLEDKIKGEVEKFLINGCGCKNKCYKLFSEKELLAARIMFTSYPRDEKNCYILGQLQACSRHSELAKSSRQTSQRKHQTFEYRVNMDRPVCRQTFLFYHAETIKRLERLKKHLNKDDSQPLLHGNKGRKPACSYDTADVEIIIRFMINLAENHGLPDPGRDVRRGNGRLRILLPSIMNYTSVHKLYTDSINVVGGRPVGYDTFIKTWQKNLPHIVFNNPKTDLCLTCEDFKKQLNQIAAILDEDKEKQQEELYQAALAHLNHVKKERLYYRARIQVAQKHYKKLDVDVNKLNSKPNSRDIVMHYSWDFSQQLQYPFEEQQVGPIYFKTPRRAQLFGVCCEGIPVKLIT